MKTPTEEQIRRRAYEIYLKHGQPGRDTQNWLQAERELQQASEDVETATASWERKSNKRSGNGKRAGATVGSGVNQ
jgi:hypothetical protein